MKVRAYITASVDEGPWATVPVSFDTDAIVMQLVFGDEADPFFTYPTADPGFRSHLEAIYGAIAAHARRLPVSLPVD